MNASARSRGSRAGADGRTSMSALPETETAHAAASLRARDMATWSPMRMSPDAALLNELDTIVARSDDLARNNGIAAGAERTLVDNVIGPRLMCKPTPDRIALKKTADWADGWGREVESLWSSFADTTWFDAGDRLNFHSATGSPGAPWFPPARCWRCRCG
jgi:capsid protein